MLRSLIKPWQAIHMDIIAFPTASQANIAASVFAKDLENKETKQEEEKSSVKTRNHTWITDAEGKKEYPCPACNSIDCTPLVTGKGSRTRP